MAYYLVLCKAGHLGRRKYIPIWYAVEAENGREAAKKARNIPRVKHNHKDAILACVKTNYEGYQRQIEENNNDPYLRCKSRHEQNQIMPLIKDRILVDTHYMEGGKKYLKRKANLFFQSKRLECAFKYC